MTQALARGRTSDSYIKLDWSERDRSVIICPDDNDKFVQTVEQVIEAVRAQGSDERVKVNHQFKELLRRLGEWAYDHSGMIRHALVTRRDSNLLFLVVTKSRKYDDAFEDELTDLDVEIARDDAFDLLPLSVLAIPNVDDANTFGFITPEFVCYYRGLNGN